MLSKLGACTKQGATITTTVVFTQNTTPNYSTYDSHVTATTEDSYLRSLAADTAQDSNDANNNYVFRWDTGDQGNGYLKFDLSSIPSGATIDDVIVRLKTNNLSGDNATYAIGIYSILVSAVESEVTWNSRSSGVSWNTAGGMSSSDINQTALDTINVNAVDTWYEWSSASLVSWLQDVVDSVSTNHGFHLQRNDIQEHSLQSGYVGQSRSFYTVVGASGNRPEIVVTYTI